MRRREPDRLLCLSLLVLAAACSAPPRVENPSPFDEDDPAALPADAGAPPEAPAVDAPAATPATIAAGDLERVLDAGPATYRGAIEIEPVLFDGGERLRGWRIARWDVAWSGLQTGDVVLEVNGVAVVRPDDLTRLWQALRGAEAVVIRLERSGVERVLRYPVVP